MMTYVQRDATRSTGFAGVGDTRIDKRRNFVPYPGIVFDFVMRLVESSRNPWAVSIVDSFAFERHSGIHENLSPRTVLGDDLRSSAQEALRLIEIDCGFNIRRDYGRVLAGFTHDIHLNRKQHWDAKALQFSGKRRNF